MITTWMEWSGLAWLTWSLAVAAQGEGVKKKLIEFGWDEPGTAFMREHWAEMEQTPFDGCVFHVNYPKPEGGEGNFTWECWSRRAFTWEELQPALIDLQVTPFERFTDNFLRFNTTPADIDWFDDYSAVVHNARLAARLAREGRVKGILFDIEQYNGQLFDYRQQRDRATKPWDEYAAQARRRGREVMEAFQAEYPDITIFLTFGYCLPWVQTEGGKRLLAEASYGLLAPFLDGMVEASKETVRFVDGHELSYAFKDPARFAPAYRMMKEDLLPLVADSDKYRRVFQVGFGLWLDCGWREHGWDPEDFSKNFYTPEQFEASLRAALERCDEYVWVYSETPRWWSPERQRVKLPLAYWEAVARAKAAANR